MKQPNMGLGNTDNFLEALHYMEAGVLLQKLASALQSTALATTAHGNGRVKGKVALEFTLSKVNEEGFMINIDHKLIYSKPTTNGKSMEEAVTSRSLPISRTPSSKRWISSSLWKW